MSIFIILFLPLLLKTFDCCGHPNSFGSWFCVALVLHLSLIVLPRLFSSSSVCTYVSSRQFFFGFSVVPPCCLLSSSVDVFPRFCLLLSYHILSLHTLSLSFTVALSVSFCLFPFVPFLPDRLNQFRVGFCVIEYSFRLAHPCRRALSLHQREAEAVARAVSKQSAPTQTRIRTVPHQTQTEDTRNKSTLGTLSSSPLSLSTHLSFSLGASAAFLCAVSSVC